MPCNDTCNPLPRLSIVVPSYNQSRFLSKALDSILSQSYPNLELIVIDGGSSDNSLQILHSYSSSLAYWCSEPDGGHGHALLKGFEIATGDIMAWLNSDDVYFPWSLHAVAHLFQQFTNVDWITGRGVTRNDEGYPLREEHSRKNFFSFLIGDFGWIQQESTFWRRSLWELAKAEIVSSFSNNLTMVDSAVWCSFFKHADLYNADIMLGSYRQHLDNRAQQDPRRCVNETASLVSKIMYPYFRRSLFLAYVYMAIRHVLSLYPIRKTLNTNTIQSICASLLRPPPFHVARYDRFGQQWIIVKEEFFFMHHRPHSVTLLLSILGSRLGVLNEYLSKMHASHR